MEVKNDFPIFQEYPDLVYLDSAATAHKPFEVIRSVSDFYLRSNANVSRGLYDLSAKATKLYETGRKTVASFINCDPKQVCFTYGTTDAINKVAFNFIEPNLQSESNLVITQMEHHANFLPWQKLAKDNNCELRVVSVDNRYGLNYAHLSNALDENTAVVALCTFSNVTGVKNDLGKVRRLVGGNIPIVVDAAQHPYHGIDVAALDVDFLAFSGHKIFAPTGIGALYVHERHHKSFNPHFTGGGMVNYASNDEVDFRNFPAALEPGTPNIAGVIGLVAAIEYVNSLGHEFIGNHIKSLTDQCVEKLQSLADFELIGDSDNRHGIISFYHPTIHAHDIAQFLAEKNIAVRAGHHCAQPLLNTCNLSAVVRVSFSIYNVMSDIEKLVNALDECVKFFNP